LCVCARACIYIYIYICKYIYIGLLLVELHKPKMSSLRVGVPRFRVLGHERFKCARL